MLWAIRVVGVVLAGTGVALFNLVLVVPVPVAVLGGTLLVRPQLTVDILAGT